MYVVYVGGRRRLLRPTMTEHNGATIVEAADEQITNVTVNVESTRPNGVSEVTTLADTESGGRIRHRFKPNSSGSLAVFEGRKATAEGMDGEYPTYALHSMIIPPEVKSALGDRGFDLA